jgi:hypothetical protein
MLICPTSSHLTTVDANVDVMVVVAVVAMMFNATTAGGTIRAGQVIPRPWLCIPAESGRILTEVGQKAPSGKYVKVRYNTGIIPAVESGGIIA